MPLVSAGHESRWSSWVVFLPNTLIRGWSLLTVFWQQNFHRSEIRRGGNAHPVSIKCVDISGVYPSGESLPNTKIRLRRSVAEDLIGAVTDFDNPGSTGWNHSRYGYR